MKEGTNDSEYVYKKFKPVRPRCPRCDSGLNYIKFREKKLVCRKCGLISDYEFPEGETE